MPIDSAGTDDEVLGNLRITEPLSQQTQYLYLPSGQPIEIGGYWLHYRS
jgi:hypothetical protein